MHAVWAITAAPVPLINTQVTVFISLKHIQFMMFWMQSLMQWVLWGLSDKLWSRFLTSKLYPQSILDCKPRGHITAAPLGYR